ncbi:MAG TPA: endonuclease Q family protein [Lacunisphaera sp.]|nr:endonuclease Q family protein [Lacunisphaera sp.]
MTRAFDLHLHSRYADKVSPAMTLENIAWWALRKGVDVLGTGDCLQPQWLTEIEALTEEAEPGLRKLKSAVEKSVQARLPAGLHRSLRFVLSTEVNCAPKGTDPMRGLHQLLYFPSLAVAREFATRIAVKGDLQEGRPTLAISARDLLKGTRHFDRVFQAPAHVMNPWFSALGVIGGGLSLEPVYGDELPRLLAVETGLTSNPAMCRRVPDLDRLGLFSCSDAHSPEKLGRECTLLEVEPDYDAIMAALRAGRGPRLKGTLKVPLSFTRYYLNWCGKCQDTFDAKICAECGNALTPGSRDHSPRLTGFRSEPLWPPGQPPSEALLPLAEVIAAVSGSKPENPVARREAGEIVTRLGRHERYILAEASLDELLTATRPEVAGALMNQRRGVLSRGHASGPRQLGQLGLEL